MGCIFDEKFEVVGYEESGWIEYGGVESTIDPDADTINAGSPTGWASKCLKISYANSTYIFNSIGADPIMYWRVELVLTAETLNMFNSIVLFRLKNNSKTNPVLSIDLSKDFTGALSFICKVYHDGTLNNYTSFISPTLNTKYKFEMKWDTTNNLWAWKINGDMQPNDQDSTNPVLSEGILTATHTLDAGTIFLGEYAILPFGYTCYYDLIACADAHWVSDLILFYEITMNLKGFISILSDTDKYSIKRSNHQDFIIEGNLEFTIELNKNKYLVEV